MRSIELFAGCGGLALGLARAGFHHELVVELDVHAVGTLNENKRRKVKHVRHWTIEAKDIRDVDFSRIAKGIDLVAGGPPCQPFSIGGRHLGPDDERNLWPEAIRSIRELRPKAFLFENVRGLMRPAFRTYLDYLKLSLAYSDSAPYLNETWESHHARLTLNADNGAVPSYTVVFQLINTADYGAPQRRDRIIAMGIRTDIAMDWPFPPATHSRESLIWSKSVTNSYWKKHGQHLCVTHKESIVESGVLAQLRNRNRSPRGLPWLTVRDAIGDLPVPTEVSEPVTNHRLRCGAKVYPRHTGSNWDLPAKALKAGDHGVPGGENMLILEEGSVRYFTLREMARLQGFPDDFVFANGWKRPIKQLGNAVPVQVGEALGRAIANILRRASRSRIQHET